MIRVCFIVSAISLLAADEAPGWLREISTTKTQTFGPKVPAVVLLNEERTTVDESGRRTTTKRMAVKILTKEGASAAFAAEPYHTDTAKIKSFAGWMLYASGNVKKYGKEDILDASMTSGAAGGELYSQSRMRIVSGKREADIGNVFGYESISEDKTVFAQETFEFQNRLPVVVSRYVLTLPAGWNAKSVVLNQSSGLEPNVQGSIYTWQINDLPFIEDEEASPAWSAIAPRVAISYFPPPGSSAGIRPLADWADVARWMAELADPKTQVTPAIEAKARDLTKDAKTEFEKIQAIGRFVQATTYVLISRGVGRGGGYTPHAAADIFAKGYGDCKDKTTLMRAMLKAVGIEAVGVGIFSGDRTAVKPEWASPHQFNHAITAIRVSKETQAPAVFEDPKLGRLMLFDPTDDIVAVGYLPNHEQASYALIEDGKAGALVLTPVAPPVSANIRRTGEVTLTPEGAISGTLVEIRKGPAVASRRRMQKELSKPEFDKSIERWLASSIPGVRVKKVEVADAGGEFKTSVEFESDRYSQIPNQKMQIFRAAVFRHFESVRLTEKTRKQPVVLNTDAFEEEIRVLLPQGFKVDEIPSPIAVKSEYGSYQAKWDSQVGSVVFTRKLEVPAKTIPAAQYAQVKKFFDTVYGSGNQPVVLMR
jgi:hypothetical protein